MKIAIMGSGGVGAYVGARLQDVGAEVHFIARGAHLKALQTDGLRIEMPGKDLHLPKVAATDQPADVGPVDLIVFAVKLWDTEAAALQMQPMVGPNTRILTLQNGIDSLDLIRAQHPNAVVLGGVIYVSAVIDRPGVIRSPGGFHRIVMDRHGGDAIAAELAALADKSSGLDVVLADDAQTVIWEKFIALSSFSGATSLLRARIGEILANAETRAFLRDLLTETMAVGLAAGIRVRPELEDESVAKLQTMPPSFRSSMSEDLERGKPLELRWLSGRVHALGLELGVPTPAHTAVYRGLVLHAGGKAE
ncbi:MAG: 2-dehydropantoate 2-reductase [Burkholderiales bacterium PBB3]|nr:MAG: 2-dehydropantoate 2-reductase [Burkholderiales bacterium PBB3]